MGPLEQKYFRVIRGPILKTASKYRVRIRARAKVYQSRLPHTSCIYITVTNFKLYELFTHCYTHFQEKIYFFVDFLFLHFVFYLM